MFTVHSPVLIFTLMAPGNSVSAICWTVSTPFFYSYVALKRNALERNPVCKQ